ncbi:endopeptidase La [Pseudoflavonifractor sp. An85]|uniref:endopeptidase La n=1 Tax=Pseudoflavonifractor sp. An85 TaxID=1965661 RepID=UPI000B5703B9|nr:endopeptidase La [Pseudoflavonifractor sp. An85]OUN25027.1 endopeptidase La [Pseudoflavonifractor sp. An85]
MTTKNEHEIVAMPALALRAITVFPNLLLHFDVGREISIRALEQAMAGSREIFLVTQKELAVEEPTQEHLYTVGTVATVKQILRLPENNVRVMVEGKTRGRMLRLLTTEPYLTAELELLEEVPGAKENTPRTEALIRQIYSMVERYTQLSDRVSPEVYLRLLASDDPAYIADYAAQNMPLRFEDKQVILEELRPTRRLEKLARILAREVEIRQVESELEGKVQEQMAENQRDYYMREQLKVIQRELGDRDDGDEIAEYRQRVREAKLPDEVREKLNKEIKHLEKQPYGSAEASVLRGYLDTCLELPWMVKTKERANVATVSKVLETDHYGLEKVKERILEFVAVKQLSPDIKGQVLCLVGPPGVGKTSIAMSVAKAMNRKLARISLGGVHDEAEIRGHRKTYVGAMPGRIIAGIRQAGSVNPVLVLDELDKVGSDHRGDPSAALLEVLDVHQNATFRDHYLEMPFDLSDVLFIATANTTDTIPRPLLDRMEIIEIGSYTDEEKLQIAKRHLWPKELKAHGLTRSQVKLTDEALRQIISGYTRESGVRRLERLLDQLCRKAAMKLVREEVKSVPINPGNLQEYLGVRRYAKDKTAGQPQVGVVNGLAWTSVGGEILEVEVNVVDGTGKVELTGNLGDVMKESARTALSFIRSRAKQLGLEGSFYKDKDIHVHFPEGAVPKDGPSAGIAITTAMVSALTGVPVRGDVAMTGEVTLRGRVLAIGGLKEKTMAALRNGMSTVILPQDNVKDLEEIDPLVRESLKFLPVTSADQVLAYALVGECAADQTCQTIITPDPGKSPGVAVNLCQ